MIAPSRDQALKDLVDDFDRLCSLNRATTVSRRLEHFRISGAEPNDYCERIFTVIQGNVLAGIRWAGGNPSKPFVNIWPDFAISSQRDIENLVELATKEFAVFSPKEISFWLNPETPVARQLRKQNTPRLRYIVGPVDSVRKLERPNKYSRVTLIRPDCDEYYSWYEESYREFHKVHGDLKDWVPLNDKEEMEECRKCGLLFYVHIDGFKAGLIAGNAQSLMGLPGVYFTEIMLTAGYKGQGLAPAVQRKFIDGLSDEYVVVWGTIDAKNVASSKTAMKVGRRSIREEFFIDLK